MSKHFDLVDDNWNIAKVEEVMKTHATLKAEVVYCYCYYYQSLDVNGPNKIRTLFCA